jgi:hypothetical protein
MEWLASIWESLTWTKLLIGAVIFLVSLAINVVIVGVVVVTLPRNYFSSHYSHDFLPDSSWLARWGATIAKNIAGMILLLLGIVMLVGPGQGILTILCGLIMLDIPGKRPFEARLVKRPAVLAAVNRLRARYGRPALAVD